MDAIYGLILGGLSPLRLDDMDMTGDSKIKSSNSVLVKND